MVCFGPKGHDHHVRDRGAEAVLSSVDAIASEWRELCRWDPALPPECAPPIAPAVITAIGQALDRPQPIGWGTDPEVEKVIDVFAEAVGSIDVAIGQLACLREAVRRCLMGSSGLDADERSETSDRLHVLLDRAIGLAAARTAERLQDATVVDGVTGLANRRALERDVRREVGRADRYRRPFVLIVVDAVGMRTINESHGYVAGDDVLRRLAMALGDVLRVEDCAYRLDGDDFCLLLPETVGGGEGSALAVVAGRIAECGAPEFEWGAASFPDDGHELEDLLRVARERLHSP